MQTEISMLLVSTRVSAVNGNEQTRADDVFVTLKYSGRRQHLLENRAIEAAGRDPDCSYRGKNRRITWWCRSLVGGFEIVRALGDIGLHAEMRML